MKGVRIFLMQILVVFRIACMTSAALAGIFCNTNFCYSRSEICDADTRKRASVSFGKICNTNAFKFGGGGIFHRNKKDYHFPGSEALDGLPPELKQSMGTKMMQNWRHLQREREFDHRIWLQPDHKGPLLFGGNPFLREATWFHFISAFEPCFCYEYWKEFDVANAYYGILKR